MDHTRRTPLSVAALGLLLAGSLTACGGGGTDPQVDAASPSGSAEPTATSSPSAAPAGYLPAPEGVVLTEPGAELEVLDPAVVAWKPRQDVVGVVDLTISRIERTTIAESFDGYDLDAGSDGSTPYFVKARVENVGDTDLGGRRLPLYVVDSSGALLEPNGIERDFAPCPGAELPAIFAPGDEATTCLVFLAPSGTELTSVMFRPPEGIVPLTWTGEPRPVKQDKSDRKRQRGETRDRPGRGGS